MKSTRFLLLLLVPATAVAHELTTRYGAFLGSAFHVFTEIDHLAAFSVMGLLAGQSDSRARMAGVATFVAALALGMVAARGVEGLGAFESMERILSATSMLAAGILVALALRLPPWTLLLAAMLLGTVHGIGNGLALAGSPSFAVSLLGVGSAAGLIAALGAWLAAALTRPAGRLAIRVVGSWVAALGLLLIGLALRG